MTYIDRINAFERWLENNYLPPLSQLLWYKMLMLHNRAGWPEWVTVDNLKLMALIGTKREATFISLRDRLIDYGWLEYRKGKKGSPNSYKLLSKNTFTSEVQTVAQTVVKSEVQTVVQTADLYRLKTETKTKEKDTIVSQKKKEERNIIPPTVEMVEQYCLGRNNGISGSYFIDFYASKGWMIGKNKMKDWQSAIRTWEKNRKQNAAEPEPEQPQLQLGTGGRVYQD